MAEPGSGRNASESRAGGQAETWPPGRTRSRPVLAWPDHPADLVRALAAKLYEWLIAEVGAGRLFPWLPIAFGFGIVLYFTAEREPLWWAPVALTAALAAAAVLSRHRAVGFPIALGLAAIAAGFATATLKTVQIAHPILAFPASNVTVEGFVEQREERERTDRIVVRVNKIEAARIRDKPDRIRVSLRRGAAPPVGAYVRFRARLNPPLEPLRPGGYDFARDLYFQGIGAVGFVLGAITTVEAPASGGLWLRYAAAIQKIRDDIDARIRAVIPGDRGAIASALITGKRDAITTPVNDAMYISSLAHVLSISGYHMALVAGVVFFLLRALLALVPTIASRQPIKKWAALVALIASALYLLLSGSEVATQRSFIMIAIVLVGVMLDRAALTLRTLAIAALAVLLIAPQAVVHPSFQMSFAATLALIAAYTNSLWWKPNADTSLAARAALWGWRETAGLILASLVAGLATTPYAAFHFHRVAPYGVLANLGAMPVVSVWVMPSGLLALLAIPFGFDAPLWRAMGEGIGVMIALAQWCAALPGAVGRMPAFGTGPLLLCSAGMVVLCLLRSPLRWSGAVLVAFAIVLAIRTPRPDVLISTDGLSVAVRQANGTLTIHKTGSAANFAVREWLAADGDTHLATDKTLAGGFRCDDQGCVARLPDGQLVALSLRPEAFADDCANAVVVVTARVAPPACAATIIDRERSRAFGAMALLRDGARWDIVAARPPGSDRPWARASPERSQPLPRVRPAPPDATPRLQDLEPGD